MHYFNKHDRILKDKIIDLIIITKRITCNYDLSPCAVAVTISVDTRESLALSNAVTHTPSISVQELQNQSTVSLDFCQYPLPKRSTDCNILIHDRKYMLREEKIMTLLTCKNWMWEDTATTWKMKTRMATVEARLIAYDAGYRLPFVHHNLILLDTKLKTSISNRNESVK